VSKSVIERAFQAVGIDGVMSSIPPEQHARLLYEWRAWARPEQLPPEGNWRTWLVLAGRGFGKTRTGAEWVRARVASGQAKHVIIAGPTAGDIRDVMIEGESGLLAVSPPWDRPLYEPSKSRVTWPNGAVATLIPSEEPERFRGKQASAIWCDELAAWQYGQESWDMLQFGNRLGSPRVMVTTTPKPSKLLNAIIADPTTIVTRGSTFDNASNLSPEFIATMHDKYDGTRLGRQELYAEVLNDVEGALWSHALIERARIRDKGLYDLQRVVVAVDPSGSAKKTADEAGIVVAGVGNCTCKGKLEMHGFVLEDLSGRYSPDEVGRRAVGAYHRYNANRLVAEDNFGGQIVADLIHLIDPRVAYKAVRASRGKIVRAEPVAAMYEQGKVHHVGMFAKMEDEMTTFTSSSPTSPGRLDAVVWALTDLLLDNSTSSFGEYEPMRSRRV
jgi:phage terminase large subunit-like protein